MNETESFTPGRRARVLMLVDDAARSHWRALGARYLTAQGRPSEYRDGDPAILRALFDSASEFANGFAITLDTSEHSSRWVVQNHLDLHGMHRDEARQQVAAFLAECRVHQHRCVRIVHGKGHGSPGRIPVLKRLVLGWLMQRQEVLAYCQARTVEGGAGAVIVLLTR